MEIRKVKKRDYMQIAKLIIEEFSKPPYNDKRTIEEALTSIENDVKKGEAFVAVYERVIGFIILTKEKIDGETFVFLENLIVDSRFQGKGIGKKLVETVERKFKGSRITLTVNRKSKAYQFYKKLGYKENKINVNMSKRV